MSNFWSCVSPLESFAPSPPSLPTPALVVCIAAPGVLTPFPPIPSALACCFNKLANTPDLLSKTFNILLNILESIADNKAKLPVKDLNILTLPPSKLFRAPENPFIAEASLS